MGPPEKSSAKELAVVGMACRFPGGAASIDQFWQILVQGKSTLSEVPSNRFSHMAHYHPTKETTGAYNWRGAHFLNKDPALFDPQFFKISVNEAKAMDPQQRQLLEVTYEAIENAGIPLKALAGSKTGVYVGVSSADYDRITSRDPEYVPQYQTTGTGLAYLSNRLSYTFDLRGPSLSVDTGCSAAMVALHLACQSLAAGESKQAIVGGVNLLLDPMSSVCMSNMRFFNNDGRCYTYDNRGDGYGRGEGVGCVILKPLSDAIRDADPVHAVICNTAVNQDGHTPGITMPSEEAQASMIQTAYESAGLDMSLTAYVESHGTGTMVGDPIEAGAIGTTIGRSRLAHQLPPALVGSVKTNLGHLEAASGLAGLIKTVLILKHGVIPPNINFEQYNPKILAREWGIAVPTKMTHWPDNDVRQASINNFGYGGTNCHAILRSVPVASQCCQESTIRANKYIIVISAHSRRALTKLALQLKLYLINQPHLSDSSLLPRLMHSLACRRYNHGYRAAFVVDSIIDLLCQLNVSTMSVGSSMVPPKLVFCFTGQGAQWYAMGRGLLASFPVYRSSLLRLDLHLANLGANWSLIEELGYDEKNSRLSCAELSQPTCTAVQIALVDLLRSMGIKPIATIGHSSGEIAAAYSAGAFSAEDAIHLAYARGLAVSGLRGNDQGSMMAVGLSEEEVKNYIGKLPEQLGLVRVACLNSPKSVTVSGDTVALEHLHDALQKDKVFSKKLKVDRAYHSHYMKACMETYHAQIAKISPRCLQEAKFYSTVYGENVENSRLGSEYWVQNLVSQVKFHTALEMLLHDTHNVFPKESACVVEIGPHSALAGPIKQTWSLTQPESPVDYLPTLVRNQDSITAILDFLGKLFIKGYDVDFDGIAPEKSLFLHDLPPYPWDHSTAYWHESRLSAGYRLAKYPRHQLLGVRSSDWNPVQPSWRNVLRASENQWVKGHQVQGRVIYPAAGYVSLVLQACQQLAEESVRSYILKDVHFLNALILDSMDSQPMELSLRLQRLSRNLQDTAPAWLEFNISSTTDGGSWLEHCRGIVSIQYKNDTVDAEWLRESEYNRSEVWAEFKKAADRCVPMDNHQVYHKFGEVAVKYSNLFRCMREVHANVGICTAVVETVDSASLLPDSFEHSQIVHPATLDGCFQTILPAMLKGHAVKTSMLPVQIREMVVSGCLTHDPGTALKVLTTTKRTNLNTQEAKIMITDKEGEPLVEIKRFFCKSLPTNSSQSKESYALCHRVHWVPDIDLMEERSAKKIAYAGLQETNPTEEFEVLEIAVDQQIRHCLANISDADVAAHAKEWHRQQYDWFKHYAATHPPRPGLPGLQEKAESFGAIGTLVYRIGAQLPDIILGRAEPLEIMTRDNLLHDMYRSVHQQRTYEIMCNVLRLLMQKNPNMRVIELGAGTGGATTPILQAFSPGRHVCFQRYDFTDISPAFFEDAKSSFSSWGSRITYNKLDIEVDPVAQGFEPEGYDLVIASNVLHATSSINLTLQNTKRLLKPGGKLIMLETVTDPSWVHLTSGTLPGWWKGAADGRALSPQLSPEKWNCALKVAGFTGVDVHVPDYTESRHHQMSVMLSSALPEAKYRQTGTAQIIYSSQSDLTLCDTLKSRLGYPSEVVSLEKSSPTSKICICTFEVSKPILATCDDLTFQKIKRVMLSASIVVWVTAGGTGNCQVPENGLIAGLMRTFRLSNRDSKMYILDIQDLYDNDSLRIGQAIAEFCQKTVFQPTSNSEDREFVYKDGVFILPRFIEDQKLCSIFDDSLVETKLDYFLQASRPLKLGITMPGFLDSLQFTEDLSLLTGPGPTQVSFTLRAAGLNFADIMTCMGQLDEDNDLLCESAGIVIEVGSEVQGIRPGDRIVTSHGSNCASVVYADYRLVVPIPSGVSYEEAVSLPVVYLTAYYSMVHLAGIRKGESILIHSAAGGVGQAAIQLSQHYGCTIYATVGSAEKRRLLIDTYGIPDEHIFSSRHTAYSAGLKRLTNGNGVNVVLNSLTGEHIPGSFSTLATFGRFVEIGKADLQKNSRLDMGLMRRNISFFAVDLAKIGNLKMDLASSLLHDVFRLYEAGAISHIKPLNVFPIPEIEQAMRLMQAGKHMGKVIVSVDGNTKLKITSATYKDVTFRADSSYLLVGGLGGIGREICKWMVERNAKTLILVSRSGLNSGNKAFVSELEALGTAVDVHACDAADPKALKRVIESSAEKWPPIRGVIQSSMLVEAMPNEQLTAEAYQAALETKVEATRNLHNCFTGPDDLDFFVMLSSASGVLGNFGLAGYASGCTFQDSFARYRQSHGLPAVSLDLGMIESAGYVSQSADAFNALMAQGFEGMNVSEVLLLLGSVIATPPSTPDTSQVMLAVRNKQLDLDGETPSYLLNPMLGPIRASKIPLTASTQAVATTDVRQQLAHASSQKDCVDTVETAIAGKLSKLLGAEESCVRASPTLLDLGIDSLIAVELRNWISMQLATNVHTFEILAPFSLHALALAITPRSSHVKKGIFNSSTSG
ncbi:ketoacyl-synt-domain-containing protein [Aspergillus costaricaensis CBS 115574]|uniref:Ketoacyl-synt-domain-containing protein n=1 Tax=Aspergillus costaricaensis CBS 115574 TaxID=1448317 RepID=A0ACD1I728_9EURO|nr:ketoacyl-synt-domain-containing protein [Aspergillus costaricaensis CBS 115574]RAK85572.1 ketoacyl-synt-domain-containing protein [Aspergillus costaricaensis CBS 115574]